MRIFKIALAAALCAALLGSTGCILRRERLSQSTSTIKRTDSEAVSLDGAKTGEVVVMMGAGELKMAGGASSGNLIDGTFTYAPASLKPVIEPASLGDSHKQVVIRNERSDGLGDFRGLGGVRLANSWDVRLTEEVPVTQLSVTLGAGDSDLDLRTVDVERLTMNLGAGDAMIDLSGERTHDVTGAIQAGAGEVTIKVPSNVGVRVMGAQDGLGDWSAPGFTKQGNYYVNEAYATSDVKIELNVQRGVGQVRLELVD